MLAVKQKGLLFLKGMAMGAADVVPGVSGGTIAFITGIYETLLNSIKAVDLTTLKLLFTGKFKAFWTAINGNFLITLIAGIFTSVLVFARLVLYLLENEPVLIWSFFFGLIIASTVLVIRTIKKWKVGVVISFILGIVIAYLITAAAPTETSNSVLFVFFSGAIAICAMILPGISGSFILLLLGKYQYILGAIKSFNLVVIGAFGAGCVIGIIAFAKVLSFLLKKYHDLTIAILSGFMLGSLNKVWPWKQVLETYTNSKGELKPLFEKNVSPQTFEALTGNSAQLLPAIGLMLFGLGFVLAIDYFANKKSA